MYTYFDNGNEYPVVLDSTGRSVTVEAVPGRPLPTLRGSFDPELPAGMGITLPGEHAKPYVGMPATVGVGSDCYPATVTEVSSSGHRVEVMMMQVAADNLFLPSDEFRVAHRRRDGRYNIDRGTYVSFGERAFYRSPEF